MRTAPGHSLVEVLVAGLVLLTGLLPVGAALGAGARLAGRGRARAEAALAVMARLDLLRVEALRTSPPCAALADGAVTQGPRQEHWIIGPPGPVRQVTVVVTVQVAAGLVADTGQVRFRCH